MLRGWTRLRNASDPLLPRDAAALIGFLAILECEVLASQLDAGLVKHVSGRLAALGIIPKGASERDFRQALNDLSHGLRHVKGEYETPPEPLPVP